MKNAQLGTALIFLVMALSSIEAWAINCMGGPTPFSPIQLWPKFNHLETRLGAQDFNLWEETGKVVFRTYDNQLREYSLYSGLYTGLTPMDRRMSDITETQNRYVVTEGRNLIFDTHTDTWQEFNGAEQPLRHLFWSGNDLYTLNRNMAATGKHTIEVFRYHYGDREAIKVCSMPIRPETKLAEGFHFPHFRLYSVHYDWLNRQHLDTYLVDVTRNCAYTQESPNGTGYPGRIQEIYNFNQDASYAIKTDNQNSNFLWVRGNRCTPHKLSGQQPMILDYQNPTVATWTRGKGLEIAYLEQGNVARLVENWNISEFTPRDARLTSNHQLLFISPLLQGESQRKLVQVELQN
ncbi:MAG: hypothetical protein H6617_08375 [Bdellovibrionaceae bacterium]|nr:hypothetical protein [Pseudobdellovibrionaceae bacterium]